MVDNSLQERGVLYPARLPTFHRYPVAGQLAAYVRWFWIPEWNLQAGQISRQHLISFPACNLVVEHDKTVISGPTTRASFRDLTDNGWAVGALLQPAAAPHFIENVKLLRDTELQVEFPHLTEGVHQVMISDMSPDERNQKAIAAFSDWLIQRLGSPTEEGLLANSIVQVAETQSDVLTVTDFAEKLHISVRSLQRLTEKYVGLTPTLLIRRRRLQEAAAKLREQPDLNLSDLAYELGYTDHSHLTNEWRTVLGFTPSSYRSSATSSQK